jgi:opacity protein-like surface antigen
MKLLAVAAATAILMFGTAAQAQQKSPFYAEAGYTFMKIDDPDGGNTRPGNIRLIGGYDFHPNFALEGLAAWSVNDDTQTVPGGTVKLKVSDVYGVYGKAKYNYQNFEFFGRAGFARTKVKFEERFTSGLAAGSGSDSDSDFSYGVGVNYQINPKWYAGVDYMVYNDSDDARVRGFTLSVGYRF